MPRLPRLHVPGGHYHVILRGNYRRALFDSNHDRVVLNDLVAEALARESARMHMFCWMTNHLHAVIQVGDSPLGSVMHRIANRYARYRHRQLQVIGHLFERRYKAWLVDADMYFCALLRYIHLNPVKARMVASVDDYPWSSHHAYIGTSSLSWLTVDFGLSLLGSTIESARDAYRTLINQESYASEDRLHDDANPGDRRVIGTDRFMSTLKTSSFKPKRRRPLGQLAEEICLQYGVSPALVCSSSRQRRLTPVRIAIAMQALDDGIATVREVAELLRREPQSLSELLTRYRRS